MFLVSLTSMRTFPSVREYLRLRIQALENLERLAIFLLGIQPPKLPPKGLGRLQCLVVDVFVLGLSSLETIFSSSPIHVGKWNESSGFGQSLVLPTSSSLNFKSFFGTLYHDELHVKILFSFIPFVIRIVWLCYTYFNQPYERWLMLIYREPRYYSKTNRQSMSFALSGSTS